MSILVDIATILAILAGVVGYVLYMRGLRKEEGSMSEKPCEKVVEKKKEKKEKDAFVSMAETMQERKEGEEK